MIESNIRNDPKLLLKAALTGIIDVWKIVVGAVEAAGQDVLEKVRNIEATIGESTSDLLRQTLFLDAWRCIQRHGGKEMLAFSIPYHIHVSVPGAGDNI